MIEDPDRLDPRRIIEQQPQKLVDRRLLIMRGKQPWLDPVAIWIDDVGSCARMPSVPYYSHHLVDTQLGVLDKKLFHMYRDDDNRKSLIAIRCPASITSEERDRVLLDLPEGSGIRRFREWIKEHGSHPKKTDHPTGPTSDEDFR